MQAEGEAVGDRRRSSQRSERIAGVAWSTEKKFDFAQQGKEKRERTSSGKRNAQGVTSRYILRLRSRPGTELNETPHTGGGDGKGNARDSGTVARWHGGTVERWNGARSNITRPLCHIGGIESWPPITHSLILRQTRIGNSYRALRYFFSPSYSQHDCYCRTYCTGLDVAWSEDTHRLEPVG
jgi:hypothetical protein